MTNLICVSFWSGWGLSVRNIKRRGSSCSVTLPATAAGNPAMRQTGLLTIIIRRMPVQLHRQQTIRQKRPQKLYRSQRQREVGTMANRNQFPSQEVVERVRKMYPKGCRVELISMDDPYSRLSPGDRGTVNMVDDTGTVFVSWDCGSSLGIIYGVDRIRKI